jgi:hypothetical protein
LLLYARKLVPFSRKCPIFLCIVYFLTKKAVAAYGS